jgi:AcrR family transcriptional regulator
MMSPRRLSKLERRAAIIAAVRPLFAEKGCKGVTTRELGEAAGISEALLFRHFPNKEALYTQVQLSSMHEETARAAWVDALPESTKTLVFMLGELMSRVVSGEMVPGGEDPHFWRMILNSIMEGSEFARQALQGMPSRMNRKLAACLEAAVGVGDARPGPPSPWVAGWFATHLGAMLMIHLTPEIPVIDYGTSKDDLARQALWFCLRGMGVKDEAIARCLAYGRPTPPTGMFP